MTRARRREGGESPRGRQKASLCWPHGTPSSRLPARKPESRILAGVAPACSRGPCHARCMVRHMHGITRGFFWCDAGLWQALIMRVSSRVDAWCARQAAWTRRLQGPTGFTTARPRCAAALPRPLTDNPRTQGVPQRGLPRAVSEVDLTSHRVSWEDWPDSGEREECLPPEGQEQGPEDAPLEQPWGPTVSTGPWSEGAPAQEPGLHQGDRLNARGCAAASACMPGLGRARLDTCLPAIPSPPVPISLAPPRSPCSSSPPM